MHDDQLEKILDRGVDLIQFYREHPCIAASELLGVDFAPVQKIVFRDMWFKNYTITVMGRGGGKTWMLGVLACLSCLLYPGYRVGLIGPVFRQSLIISNNYDTFWTTSGMVVGAEDMYESVVPNITQTQSFKSQNTILSKWKNDDRACRRIKTTKGFELAGTVDHAIIVLDDDADIVYKDLQDVKDDYIAIKTGFNYFGNNDSMPSFDEFEHDWRTKDCLVPKLLTEDLAYWMGLLVGDGCVTFRKKDKKPRLDFVNEDRDLLDSFHRYTKEYFGIETKECQRRNNTKELQFSNKKLCMYLLKCGFTKTIALDKKIPDVIKKASKENVIAFLQGLFDTDGCVYVQKNKACEITFNASSLQLAKEVQSVLLNLGIVSNLGIGNKKRVKQLPQGNKPSKCAESYKIRITGQTFIKKFNGVVGFRCRRKNADLKNYLCCHFDKEESLARSIGLPQEIVERNYFKCKDYLDQGLYFVKMVKSNYFFAPTMDMEVENEECYWANGFINHNSKNIFMEVEKLWDKSPILKEATAKKPTRGSDSVYLPFKSSGDFSGSYIEGLPLADGSKIRGSRYYLICIDELAQVNPTVLDTVIRPMAATILEPMKNVRRLQRQKKLIEMGLATEEDFEESTVNKMIMTSSGYYKFNHMWKRMKDYWKQVEKHGSNSQYAVHQIPYWFLPEGFLDLNSVMEAKRVMSKAGFQMEYEATMISDSEGFFKASLLEACTFGSEFSVELGAEPGENYIMGVDPNQGGSASCGVVVVKLGKTNKVVSAIELKTNTTPELAKAVQSLSDQFNATRIYMDKGGGGKAVCDLLEEGYNDEVPIIDITNDNHKKMEGRHILEMVNFSPSWISDANYATLSLLEDKKLRFPEPPTSASDVEAGVFEAINVLKSQMLNIVVTQKASGVLHFDTPKKGQNKDLYSAMILVGYGIRAIEKDSQVEEGLTMYSSGGLMKEHRSGASWERVDAGFAKGGDAARVCSEAVLTKKK
jgi:hypothetical protein